MVYLRASHSFIAVLWAMSFITASALDLDGVNVGLSNASDDSNIPEESNDSQWVKALRIEFNFKGSMEQIDADRAAFDKDFVQDVATTLEVPVERIGMGDIVVHPDSIAVSIFILPSKDPNDPDLEELRIALEGYFDDPNSALWNGKVTKDIDGTVPIIWVEVEVQDCGDGAWQELAKCPGTAEAANALVPGLVFLALVIVGTFMYVQKKKKKQSQPNVAKPPPPGQTPVGQPVIQQPMVQQQQQQPMMMQQPMVAMTPMAQPQMVMVPQQQMMMQQRTPASQFQYSANNAV